MSTELTREARIGLHIGVPKTGTSSLQQLCFARHSQAEYFGQSNVWRSSEAETVLKAMMVAESAGASEAHARGAVRQALQRRRALIVSDEALSFRTIMKRARLWPCITDHVKVAAKAKRILGPAHVLLVLRNQADWLESWHRQGLKSGGHVEREFERWLEGSRTGQLFELLNYQTLYRAFAEVFGTQFVHVRLYEAYRHELGAMAAEFAEMIGIDAGEAARLMQGKGRNVTGAHYLELPFPLKVIGRYKPVARIVRTLPRQLTKSFNRLVKLKRPYPSMTTAQRKEIMNCFETSNRSLLNELGVDANGMGYF